MNNLFQIAVDLHRCEGESVSLTESVEANHPQLPAARYLRFKEKPSLKGLTKISRVTDNLCLEIKAGLNCQALERRLCWQSQQKVECRASERHRDGQRVREAAMLFMRGDECSRGPRIEV